MGAQDPHQSGNNITYQAAPAANVVISATPAFLHAIIVGVEGIAGTVLEVSNHASDGDGNVLIRIVETIPQTFIVDAFFDIGICADVTGQGHVSFIWR